MVHKNNLNFQNYHLFQNKTLQNVNNERNADYNNLQ